MAEEDYEFYDIEDHPDLSINRQGLVRNKVTGFTFGTPRKGSADGYRYVYDIPIHRLMARQFLPNPENKPFVNHKNGIKYDNHIDNLEWATAQENALHAYVYGLRNDNISIKIYDRVTDQTTTHYSLSEGARSIKQNPGAVTEYLKGDRKIYLKDRYVICTIDEDIEGYKLFAKRVGRHHGCLRPCEILNPKTGERLLCESLSAASRYLGSNVQSAYSGKAKTVKGWIVKPIEYVDGMVFDLKIKPMPVPNAPKRPPTPIRVTNTLTGEVMPWKTGQEMADSLKVIKNSLQKRIYLNNGMYAHFRVEYLR